MSNVMNVTDAAVLANMIEAFGVDELFEEIAAACREIGEDDDGELGEEVSRQWRVRANGVMQALRFYQAFVKERKA